MTPRESRLCLFFFSHFLKSLPLNIFTSSDWPSSKYTVDHGWKAVVLQHGSILYQQRTFEKKIQKPDSCPQRACLKWSGRDQAPVSFSISPTRLSCAVRTENPVVRAVLWVHLWPRGWLAVVPTGKPGGLEEEAHQIGGKATGPSSQIRDKSDSDYLSVLLPCSGTSRNRGEGLPFRRADHRVGQGQTTAQVLASGSRTGRGTHLFMATPTCS